MLKEKSWGSSLLYVPGDRPERIQKAIESKADAVIIDLEDAVSHSKKEAARTYIVDILIRAFENRKPVGIRVNAFGTNEFEADLEALGSRIADLPFLIAPMINSKEEVQSVLSLLDRASGGRTPPVVPLLETAKGILNSLEIASIEGVATLALGPADLAKEMNLSALPNENELLYARSTISFACAAAGCHPPIDGPFMNTQDQDSLLESAQRAKSLGFGAKQAIHPNQLSAINESFTPSKQQIAWATKIVTAFREAESQSTGAIKMEDGTFIDAPVVHRARAILEQVKRQPDA